MSPPLLRSRVGFPELTMRGQGASSSGGWRHRGRWPIEVDGSEVQVYFTPSGRALDTNDGIDFASELIIRVPQLPPLLRFAGAPSPSFGGTWLVTIDDAPIWCTYVLSEEAPGELAFTLKLPVGPKLEVQTQALSFSYLSPTPP